MTVISYVSNLALRPTRQIATFNGTNSAASWADRHAKGKSSASVIALEAAESLPCESGCAGCAGCRACGLWLGTGRRFSGDAHAQRDCVAEPFAFATTHIKPISDHIAVATSVVCVFSAAGRNVIQGDDHGRSRGLAPGL